MKLTEIPGAATRLAESFLDAPAEFLRICASLQADPGPRSPRELSGAADVGVPEPVVTGVCVALRECGALVPVRDSLDPAAVSYRADPDGVLIVLGSVAQLLPGLRAMRRRQDAERSTRARLVATVPAAPPPGGSGRRTYEAMVRSVQPLVPSLAELIRSAARQVTLVVPFADAPGTAELMPAIDDSLARGVRVSVVTRYLSAPDDRNLRLFAPLRDAHPRGVQLYEFCGAAGWGALHAKMVSVDDGAAAFVGSANLTESSMGRNLEVGVVLMPPESGKVRDIIAYLFSAGGVVPR